MNKIKTIIVLVVLILISHIIYINLYPDIREYKVLNFQQRNEYGIGIGNMPLYYVTYIDDNNVRVTQEFYQGNFIRREEEINEPILRFRNGYGNLYIPYNYNMSKLQNIDEVFVVN